jgi:hypothetical protein
VKGREVLSACFVLFGALLIWPILTIANRATLVAGIPALVLYLFTVWVGIVGFIAWAAWRAGGDEP